MSPEQAARRDRSITAPTCSAWAACCTRCAPGVRRSAPTARWPCSAGSATSTPRPIREINPDIPDWLAGVIDRLLAKNPADRIQSAAEVAELLERCLAHLQQPSLVPAPLAIPVPAVPRTGKSRLRWAVAAAVLVVAFSALGLGLTEATGVTQVIPSIGQLVVGEGTLAVAIDDPAVRLRIDGAEVSFRQTGIHEFRSAPANTGPGGQRRHDGASGDGEHRPRP